MKNSNVAPSTYVDFVTSVYCRVPPIGGALDKPTPESQTKVTPFKEGGEIQSQTASAHPSRKRSGSLSIGAGQQPVTTAESRKLVAYSEDACGTTRKQFLSERVGNVGLEGDDAGSHDNSSILEKAERHRGLLHDSEVSISILILT